MEHPLGSYLPWSVAGHHLQDPEAGDHLPFTHSYETCALFADVSGFTALCEAMSNSYPRGGGEEHLAKHLNSYFEMLVRIISSSGGDVFKFAGDAVLVRPSIATACRP